ncbi:PLDc N-terminal domain-containing protein [Streptomyces sp. NPDC048172]|uniref:PLDc N-terminal domain-containing protein n=1 Tax=Streptomyces sp. NPDC048172 TaxID=3365505 RepID=UPI00371BA919
MDDYPLLDVFWSMLIFFLWVAWIVVLFHVVVDIFRNEELGGWGKAGWLLLVLVVPLIGVLIYLISQGSRMARRSTQLRGAGLALDPAESPSGNGTRDLERLSALHRSGSLTDAEFVQAKHQILPM